MYNVFVTSVGWSDVMFIIDHRINYRTIKSNPQTSMLNKSNFIGKFNMEESFLSAFDKKELNEFPYYYRHLYERDDSLL